MLVPTMVFDKVVDENGYLTEPWQLLFSYLLTQMQTNLGEEGFVMPSQDDDTITTILTSPTPGTILYDTTNNEFKGAVQTSPTTVVFKTFTLT